MSEETLEPVEDIYAPSEEIERNPHTDQAKEAPLKVSKDIYDYIERAKKYDDTDEDAVNQYLEVYMGFFNIDKTIELCQALKAYPNIEPIEELYYVRFLDDYNSYLNEDIDDGTLFMDSLCDTELIKSKFTMQEIKEISEKEGKDYTQFAVKVEE